MGKTKIEWADKSLNFYTWSCNKVSEGCKNCYMMAMAEKYKKLPYNGAPQWRDSSMKEYKKLKAGEIVFINSMSDTYHEGVPVEWIQRIHNLADNRPDVIFLALTKRPELLLELSDDLIFPRNLFVGTSVEMKKYIHRIDTLLQVPASGHFVSFEPLLESVADSLTIQHSFLDWLIVGAESGLNRRDFNPKWASEIRDWASANIVPFMYKQGSHRHSGHNRILEGQTWDEFPPFQDYLLKELNR